MKTYELKTERAEMGEVSARAEMKVRQIQTDAAAAENEARKIELQLKEAEVAAERENEAKEKGKETAEKMEGLG